MMQQMMMNQYATASMNPQMMGMGGNQNFGM